MKNRPALPWLQWFRQQDERGFASSIKIPHLFFCIHSLTCFCSGEKSLRSRRQSLLKKGAELFGPFSSILMPFFSSPAMFQAPIDFYCGGFHHHKKWICRFVYRLLQFLGSACFHRPLFLRLMPSCLFASGKSCGFRLHSIAGATPSTISGTMS